MSSRATTLDIRLPEGVVFSLPLAGPATRFLAWLLDLVITWAVLIVINIPLNLLNVISPDFAGAFSALEIFAVPILYGIFFEGFQRGQTPGKRILRLRVMDAGGLRLDLRQVIIRNLLRAVDILPILYLVGGTVSVLSARVQRLGDLAADTVVVRMEKTVAADLAQLASGKYNSLRDHPVLAARLRHRIPPAEAGRALQALLRRDALDPIARVELFARLAARFRAVGPLTDEAFETLTDEQLVRNVVDILFHTRPSAAAANSRPAPPASTPATGAGSPVSPV